MNAEQAALDFDPRSWAEKRRDEYRRSLASPARASRLASARVGDPDGHELAIRTIRRLVAGYGTVTADDVQGETVERRLTHAPDPVLARHVANMSLIAGPSGLRPDLDVAQGQPIAAALGAMVAYDGITRLEPLEDLRIILPRYADNRLPWGVG